MDNKLDNPIVSVCIATYNSPKVLDRLLESIENQTFRDYEIIVTDDSDNDETCNLCKSYESVKYYRNNKRLGPTNNNNRAIALASGKYIKIMHHDDWFTRNDSLQKYVDAFEQIPEGDFVFAGCDNEQKDGSFQLCVTTQIDLKRLSYSWKSVLYGAVIGAPSVTMWRRKGENPYYFDSRLSWLVDLDIYCCILKRAPRFFYIRETLVAIGQGESEVKVTDKCIRNPLLIWDEGIYVYKKYGIKSKRYISQLMRQTGLYNEQKRNYDLSKAEYLFWSIYDYLYDFAKRALSYLERHL